LKILSDLGISPPEAPERLQQLRELARRSDWDGVEIQGKALSEYLEKTVPASIESRRQRTADAAGTLAGAGITLAKETQTELEALASPPPEETWAVTVGRLARVEEALASAQRTYVEGSRERALRLADWSGLSPERRTEFVARLDAAMRPISEGRLVEAIDGIRRTVTEGLPEAKARRQASRDAGEKIAVAAKEYGTPTGRLDGALRDDADSAPERWPDTVRAIDDSLVEVGEGLRERGSQALDSLKIALNSTREYGVDPTSAQQAVEEAAARITSASPLEITPLLAEARRAAEEPIVAVVAGLLDEVRPRIAEARRLGRDPSDVFAAMNRAREALRLKIYSEALAASQEAVDRVTRLTEDLEGARDELRAVEEMLDRLRRVQFSTEPFDPQVQRVRAYLDRAETGPARELLRETVLSIGREALQYFLQRWAALDAVRQYARERGFLPAEVDTALGEVRGLLESGQLAEGVERLAAVEVELRTAAVPYVGRRIEEMEHGFTDIPDEALTAPIRRLLADADVTLRVKQELVGAVESLRRAERDFAAVFAAHAAGLVEELEAEGRVLESMGGAGDEVQRQIDEVQQIFNMGDFVQASRASQEIRKRAQQQQLLRSEEAVSHAKLALVELETMGLDLAKFRAQLDEAQSAARSGKYADAYQTATRLEQSASRTWTAAQEVVDALARGQDTLGRLREAGVDPGPFYEPLRDARTAFLALDFDTARGLLEKVEKGLGNEEARLDTTRLLANIERLIEDGRRLALPMEPFANRLAQMRTEMATAPAEATRTAARLVHDEMVAILRPVLEENLRGLERDLDIARGAGVDVERIVAPLSEARRRIALPVPAGAAALLDEARSEFVETRGFVEHAERVAKRAREALAEADLLHVEVPSLRSAMERLETGLAQRQYARVVELGGPLERELLQATYQHVSKTLAGFQATLTRLRREGGDTTVAENLLHQARMALDEGKAVEALQLASRSESELERADLQRRVAEGSLQAAERALGRAVSDGVLAPAAAEELAAAKTAFQQRDYPNVLERALAASDALGIVRENHRRAKDAVAAAERQLGEAAGLRADVTEASNRLAEARKLSEGGQYPTAVRAAREATEMARWAIERLFTGPIGELRRLVEQGRREKLTTEVDPVEGIVAEAEAALRAREWRQVSEAIDRGEIALRRVFETVVDARWREVEADAARSGAVPAPEAARREAVRERLKELRAKHDYAAGLELVRTELEIVLRRRRERVETRISELKGQLWVGERLGLDTTPIMQTFSEARSAADAGRLDDAERLLGEALPALDKAVREPFGRRLKDVVTELNFAREGLHVSVGPVAERIHEVEELEKGGHLVDAGKTLLAAEEELNLRKSLHRELMNLHYLIDAALGRAQQARIDTTKARQLLAESIRLRDTDYPAALEKAREALRLLQEEPAPTAAPAASPAAAATPAAPPAAASPPPSFWPFRRPPSETKQS
jgi:tetratricopeptide (TPR) repeat protein